MELDTNLSFAEKYNWWSSDKKNISKATKLSYIMTKGSLEELYFIFSKFKIIDLEEGFNKISSDNFSLKERRKGVIKTFFEEKKLGSI